MRTIRPSHLTRVLLTVGAVVSIAVAGSVAAGGEGAGGAQPEDDPRHAEVSQVDAGDPVGGYRYALLDAAPTPADMLRTYDDMMACFERYGLAGYGPYPSADGSRVEGSIADGPRFGEADAACTPPSLTAASAFAEHSTAADREELRAKRDALITCVVSEVPSSRDGLTTRDPVDVNEALGNVAVDEAAVYDDCLAPLMR